MAQFQVRKSKVEGTLKIPPSKSHSLRALVFAMMADGVSKIYNYLNSPDTHHMIDAIKHFGAKVTVHESHLEITGINGDVNVIEDIIQCGNSGQVLRFLGAIAALSDNYCVLTGDHSIRHNRPTKPLLEGLRGLGVMAESTRLDDKSPVIVKGPITNYTTTLDGKDSQPVSGLLIALSFANAPSTIHVTDPGEKPWIDFTLFWLDKFNIRYTNDSYAKYTLEGNSKYPGFNMEVPGDFSSAAFPIVAALITNSTLTIHPIDMDDVQGDKKIIDTLKKMGAKIEIDGNFLTVYPSKLKGIEIDINDFIDAITILAVVGTYAEGETVITNASIARKKECDRISAITAELKKMGADISEKKDGLVIRQSSLKGANVESYNDHRMVLSLSCAALAADGITTINKVGCVKKTYPTFCEDFQKIGVNMKEIS